MILTIQSENEHLFSILNKNPNVDKGLYIRELKKGTLIGKCISSTNTYKTVFLDSNNSYSETPRNKSCFTDSQSLVNPRVVLDTINMFFGHLLKSEDIWKNYNYEWIDDGKTLLSEIDSGNFETTITINCVEISNYTLEKFALTKYFNNIRISKIENSRNLYTLEINTHSVVQAINLMYLSCFMIQSDNMYYKEIPSKGLYTEELFHKIAKILSNVPYTPYFIYYLIIKKFSYYLPKESMVNTISCMEENYSKNNDVPIKLMPYSTQQARIEWIRQHIDFNPSSVIIDFGSGKFDYLKAFRSQYKHSYISYDIDIDVLAYANKLQHSNGNKTEWWIHTIAINQLYDAIDPLLQNETLQSYIIISEVIEHMENEEPLYNFLMFLAHTVQKGTRVLITTPNKAFNHYYKLNDGELRRDDHVREYSCSDLDFTLGSFCIDVLQVNSFKIVPIGDMIGDISVTLGVIIEF